MLSVIVLGIFMSFAPSLPVPFPHFSSDISNDAEDALRDVWISESKTRIDDSLINACVDKSLITASNLCLVLLRLSATILLLAIFSTTIIVVWHILQHFCPANLNLLNIDSNGLGPDFLRQVAT